MNIIWDLRVMDKLLSTRKPMEFVKKVLGLQKNGALHLMDLPT